VRDAVTQACIANPVFRPNTSCPPEQLFVFQDRADLGACGGWDITAGNGCNEVLVEAPGYLPQRATLTGPGWVYTEYPNGCPLGMETSTPPVEVLLQRAVDGGGSDLVSTSSTDAAVDGQ
jgi:hypothetical protein